MGRDERGFVVVPDRVGEGLVGWSGELVGTINRLADGVGGLEALKEGIDDEADFRLGVDEGGGEEANNQG